AMPSAHPLAAGLPWHRATSDLTNMASFFSPLLSQADGMLAIGCRFTQLTTGSWSMALPPALAQIDIHAEEIGRTYPVTVGLHADARMALRALLDVLQASRRSPWAADPRASVWEPWRLPGLDVLAPLRRVLPEDAIVAADITRLGYIMLADLPLSQPRT